jgi:hypothetical protein
MKIKVNDIFICVDASRLAFTDIYDKVRIVQVFDDAIRYENLKLHHTFYSPNKSTFCNSFRRIHFLSDKIKALKKLL